MIVIIIVKICLTSRVGKFSKPFLYKFHLKKPWVLHFIAKRLTAKAEFYVPHCEICLKFFVLAKDLSDIGDVLVQKKRIIDWLLFGWIES